MIKNQMIVETFKHLILLNYNRNINRFVRKKFSTDIKQHEIQFDIY